MSYNKVLQKHLIFQSTEKKQITSTAFFHVLIYLEAVSKLLSSRERAIFNLARSKGVKKSKNFASRPEMQVSEMQTSFEHLQPFGLLSCPPRQDG